MNYLRERILHKKATTGIAIVLWRWRCSADPGAQRKWCLRWSAGSRSRGSTARADGSNVCGVRCAATAWTGTTTHHPSARRPSPVSPDGFNRQSLFYNSPGATHSSWIIFLTRRFSVCCNVPHHIAHYLALHYMGYASQFAFSGTILTLWFWAASLWAEFILDPHLFSDTPPPRSASGSELFYVSVGKFPDVWTVNWRWQHFTRKHCEKNKHDDWITEKRLVKRFVS